MADSYEALRVALEWVAWPGMLATSAYAVFRTLQFQRRVAHTYVARLVLVMVVGWVAVMVGMGLLATVFLRANPQGAAPIAVPLLLLWAVSMGLIVWAVHRWGEEASSINLYYLELQSMDAVKTQLINTVAHELNTPLTPVKLKLDLLASGHLGPLHDKQASAVASIQRSMTRVHAIVDQVVLCMQVQSESLRPKLATVDLGALAHSACRDVHEQAHNKQVRIDEEIQGAFRLQADAFLLRRVLVSLLENAVKFSNSADTVQLRIRADGNNVCIDVTDHGAGFTGEDAEHLFEPFRQGQSVPERSDAGAGLDLYIAKGIIAAHGGTLEGRSKGPGKGARFRIKLPMA